MALFGKGGGGGSAPDPRETAAAQAGANVDALLASWTINNMGQRDPFGRRYAQQATGPDGQPLFDTINVSGNERQIPRMEQITDMSPAVSGVYDPVMAKAGGVARTMLPGPYRLPENMPDRITSTQGALAGAPDRLGTLAESDLFSGGMYTNPYSEIADAGPIERNFGESEDILFNLDDDYSGVRDTYEQALFDRMEPLIERDRARMETRLANQGIDVGSDAYADTTELFGRDVNDARLGAILAGGQEQQRALNMALSAGQFENAAQAQDYVQKMQRAGFMNAAQAQEFMQNAAMAEFGNAAALSERQQQIGEVMTDAQLREAARAGAINELTTDAALAEQARQGMIQEGLLKRNQPINELTSLLQGGAAMPTPNFGPPVNYGVQPSDIAGLTMGNYAADQQRRAAERQGLYSALGTLGGAGLYGWLGG